MSTVGERIRRARLEFPGDRLSQDAVGEMVGVTRGAVSQWESGLVADLTAIHLYKLSLALRCDFVYLLFGNERSIPEGEMSFDEIELLSLFRSMTDIGRKAARQQVEQLAKLFRTQSDKKQSRQKKAKLKAEYSK